MKGKRPAVQRALCKAGCTGQITFCQGERPVVHRALPRAGCTGLGPLPVKGEMLPVRRWSGEHPELLGGLVHLIPDKLPVQLSWLATTR